MKSLEDFNRLAESDALRLLHGCCTSWTWAGAIATARPYQSTAELIAASDRATSVLDERELLAALSGHPRIGDASGGGWTASEQAGLAAADGEVRRALAEGNAAYERRFGHIYLVCATGRGPAELLSMLRERLANDPAAEWRVVAAELAKINQVRLRTLVGAAR